MLWIGTSGYSYPEWKGSFYPADLPAKKMFAYYLERLSTVEINNTFYRMPTEKLVEDWAAAAPEGFRFTLKAPKKITHIDRLKGQGDSLAVFIARAKLLGDKLGTLLFQLPPFAKKDVPLLTDFLAQLPAGLRTAFEFRHASWHADEVYDALRGKNAALAIADSEKLTTPLVPTADYGYLRLRDEGYGRPELQRWSDAVRSQAAAWKDTFVYFKHEEAGKGPEFAAIFKELSQASAPAPG